MILPGRRPLGRYPTYLRVPSLAPGRLARRRQGKSAFAGYERTSPSQKWTCTFVTGTTNELSCELAPGALGSKCPCKSELNTGCRLPTGCCKASKARGSFHLYFHGVASRRKNQRRQVETHTETRKPAEKKGQTLTA